MSEHPHEFSVVNFGSRSRHLLGSENQRGAGHHHCELNDQFIPALDAAIDADAISSSGLGLSDSGVEELRCAKPFHKVHFFRKQVHSIVPRQKVAREHHITNAEKVTEEFANDSRIRFRAASCTDSAQLDCDTGTNAGRDRGTSLPALVHALSGVLKRNHSNVMPYQAQKITPNTITAIITGSFSSGIRHIAAPIRNFFASCSRSKDSNPQLLRSAAPTAFAVVSATHSKPSNRLRGRA